MGTDLVHAPRDFSPHSFAEAKEMAVEIAKAGVLATALQGKPADVLLTLMMGQELGLSPTQSLRGIAIIKGKPTLGADLMVGLVLGRSGGPCEYFTCVESTPTVATYETKRRDEAKPRRLSFTAQQAKQAGLGGDNWSKYPDAMLRARAKAALARDAYPEILFGVYDPDEVRDEMPAPTARMMPAAIAETSAPPKPETTYRITEKGRAALAKVEAVPVAVEVETTVREEAQDLTEPTPAERQEWADAAVALAPGPAAPEPEPTRRADLLVDIEGARNSGQLRGLVQFIAMLPDAERLRLREPYARKMAELRRAEAPHV